MNSQLIKSAVGGFVAMFLLSYVWYGVVAAEWYGTNFAEISRAEADMSMANIAIGYVLMALLLAYAYPHSYKGGPPMTEGLRFGVIMGLIVGLPAAFIGAGTTKVALIPAIVDGVYRVVEIGLGGLVIGFLHGRESQAAAEPAATEESAEAEGG